MKGVIPQCLAEMVQKKFGEETWHKILEKAELDRETVFLSTADIPDEAVLKVVGVTCEVLGVSLPQAADAFGDYWVNEFAPKLYGVFFRNAGSAREFLLNVDKVHAAAMANVPGAQPPRFEYEWKDDRHLIIHYHSHRSLIDFAVGIAKGVGKYYKEELKVTKLGPQRVEVVFSAASH